MKPSVALIGLLAASPAIAEETRSLDSHEHGVGALNIAFDGNTVAMEFHAPGADIVGFEYEAKSAEDRATVNNAVAILAKPLELFVLPEAAACSVSNASAALESEAAHDDHDDHDDHAHAKEDGHDDHGHAKEAAHDDHGHDKHEHEEHAHDDHGHEEHAEESSHTEFHAEYTLTCANPEALTSITFAYFDQFENAREVEVQMVSGAGAQAFEVERDAPVLNIQGLL